MNKDNSSTGKRGLRDAHGRQEDGIDNFDVCSVGLVIITFNLCLLTLPIRIACRMETSIKIKKAIKYKYDTSERGTDRRTRLDSADIQRYLPIISIFVFAKSNLYRLKPKACKLAPHNLSIRRTCYLFHFSCYSNSFQSQCNLSINHNTSLI